MVKYIKIPKRTFYLMLIFGGTYSSLMLYLMIRSLFSDFKIILDFNFYNEWIFELLITAFAVFMYIGILANKFLLEEIEE